MMSKDPYKIVDSKPSWMSKLSSGAVALGSVATAVVITVPGLPGYDIFTQIAVGSDGQVLDSGSAATDASIGAAGSSQAQDPTSARAISVGTANSTIGSASTTSPATSSSPATGATLALPGITSGNTSSPTPSGSSYSDDEYDDDEDEEDEDEEDDEDDDDEEDDD
jgi:hypothetical protein